jgi:hypothetical protein
VGVGDVIADAEFILGVDSQPTATGFALDVDPPSVKSEFTQEYEAAFGDDLTEDSADDRPVPELSNRGKTLLQRALAGHAPEMPDYQDLSQAHRAVADGLQFDDSVPLINHDNTIIRKGIVFKTESPMMSRRGGRE